MSEAAEKCHFCHAVPFKYSCPKCNALYCSVACYKSQTHLKCSEEFYKSCIQDELAGATTAPESQQDMRKIYDILKRMRETDAGFNPKDFDADGLDNPLGSDNEEGQEDDDDEEEPGDETEEAFEEEVEEDIAVRLKGIDINDADEVWSRLTQEEQGEFQKLIASGDIMKLMPDYKPWWGKAKNSKIVEIPAPGEAKKTDDSIPEIQENIPKFSDICQKTPSPSLHYNLWNILSAYACVTRFYAGEHQTNASEAAAHLVNLSATLKYGTNFEDAEDAIISVEMEAITTGNGPAGAAAVGSAGVGTNFFVESREQLKQDARQLMGTRDHKLAALSDILRLLEHCKALINRKSSQEAGFQKLFALASGSVELNRSKVSQLAKKIKFLLSDDQLLQAGSDSFWEPGNYKRTTKRIEDGYKLCNDLQQLIQERADIEKGYAKSLRAWSKKWGDFIEKGPEYGTTEAAWKGVLTESERVCDVHMKIKDSLCNDVNSQIKTWQKENYHHTLMQIKERKDMEDMFKKAQKPWAKLLAKVEKAKADYHSACKTERSATNQERNANADSSLSPDQVKKMHDRVQKTKDQVQKCREKYEQAISEITKFNSVYIEEMTSVYEKCQTMEKTRLLFFKDILFNVHSSLDLTKVQSLPQIYDEFYHTINNADQQKDLKWWSNNHGINMAMNWPIFVEYTEEFRDIAKGNKSKEALPAAPITLINQRPVAEEGIHEYHSTNSLKKSNSAGGSASSRASGKSEQAATPSSATTTEARTSAAPAAVGSTTAAAAATVTAAASAGAGAAVVAPNRNPSVTNGNGKVDSNPFDEEEEWDEADNVLVDNGEPGVPVKALYDYEGAESDELTFKQGEVFEKLEDEDEQGWCKGRMNGRVGLYPANYVELCSA